MAGVDFAVDAGEIVFVGGANGAGKTTLLRTCAGLVAIAEGQAEVLGVDIHTARTQVQRRIGLLGHATHLYEDLSVAENVDFWVRASGGDRSRAPSALARLGLGPRLLRLSVSRLSAGQRRRVAIAVLAARDPELWLLDEPHAGLDAEGRDLLDQVVREVADRGGTVVLASHEADRAAPLATRRVVMAGGQAFDVGDPDGNAARSGTIATVGLEPIATVGSGPIAAVASKTMAGVEHVA